MLAQRGMFDPQVQAYRAALRDRYQEIMLTDMQAATRLSIENNMWKLIYYKMIEEFRVLLKAVQAILIQSKLKPLGKGDNFEERKEGRTLLASYRAFLTDAFGFYNEFIQRMLSCYKITDSCHQVSKILDVIEPIDIIQSPNSCKADPDNEVFGVMNRSLIHLGDLGIY